jgi:hypothetical protein
MPVGRRWTAWCGVSSRGGDQQLNGGCRGCVNGDAEEEEEEEDDDDD